MHRIQSKRVRRVVALHCRGGSVHPAWPLHVAACPVRARGPQPRRPAGHPRPVEVEAPYPAKHVADLPAHKQARPQPTLHRLAVDVLQPHASAGDLRLLIPAARHPGGTRASRRGSRDGSLLDTTLIS